MRHLSQSYEGNASALLPQIRDFRSLLISSPHGKMVNLLVDEHFVSNEAFPGLPPYIGLDKSLTYQGLVWLLVSAETELEVAKHLLRQD